jgi:hypothetical protein
VGATPAAAAAGFVVMGGKEWHYFAAQNVALALDVGVF